MRKLDIIEQNR